LACVDRERHDEDEKRGVYFVFVRQPEQRTEPFRESTAGGRNGCFGPSGFPLGPVSVGNHSKPIEGNEAPRTDFES